MLNYQPIDENKLTSGTPQPGSIATPLPRIQVQDEHGHIQRRVDLPLTGLRVGNQVGSDGLQLDDPNIGRNHLRIGWDGVQATVTDLGSRTGTKLEGTPLTPQISQPWGWWQKLSVGSSTLCLEPPLADPEKTEPTSDRIGVSIEAHARALTLYPEVNQVVHVLLENLGDRSDEFTVTVEGIPTEWVAPASQKVLVNAKGHATVGLNITVPRASESRAQDYTITVRARSSLDTAESGVAQARWRVPPFIAGALEIRPKRRRGSRGAAYTVLIRNDGNAPNQYQLSGAADGQSLEFEFAQSQVSVDPGTVLPVRMVVESRNKLVGDPQTHTFNVQAAPTEGGTITDTAEFVQQVPLPRWVPWVGALLLLPLCALLLFLLPRGASGTTSPGSTPAPGATSVAVGSTAADVAAIVSATLDANAKTSQAISTQTQMSIDDTAQKASVDETLAAIGPAGTGTAAIAELIQIKADQTESAANAMDATQAAITSMAQQQAQDATASNATKPADNNNDPDGPSKPTDSSKADTPVPTTAPAPTSTNTPEPSSTPVKPLVSISGATVTEGDADVNAVFTVSLSTPSNNTVNVNFATDDDSAKADKDYKKTSGVITFNPGERTKTFPVSVIGDTINETTKDFIVNITTDNADVANGQAIGTIIDNDPLPTLSISSVNANAGSDMNFIVSMTGRSDRQVTVNYSVNDGSAIDGEDYTSISPGMLKFDSDSSISSFTISIKTLQNPDADSSRKFTVNLNNATNAGIQVAQGVGVINVSSNNGTFSIDSSVSVNEGDTAKCDVSWTGKDKNAVTVSFELMDDTSAQPDARAKSGEDYELPDKQSITFQPNDKDNPISIKIKSDSINEPNETFVVHITKSSIGDIDTNQSMCKITIKDTNSVPTVSINSPQPVDEGNEKDTHSIVFTASLSSESGKLINIDYSTIDDTTPQAHKASSNIDYTSTTGTLIFSPGEISKNITVTINPDSTPENDETFMVKLTIPAGNDSNVKIADGKGVGIGTIRNDDSAVFSIIGPDKPVPEGDSQQDAGTASFTISVDRPSDKAVSIQWETTDDPSAGDDTKAIAGTDYVAVSPTTITFNPGDTSPQTVSVKIKGDTDSENDETFAVKLIKPTGGAVIAQNKDIAVATIADDDGPSISPTTGTVSYQENQTPPTLLATNAALDGPNPPKYAQMKVVVSMLQNGSSDDVLSIQSTKDITVNSDGTITYKGKNGGTVISNSFTGGTNGSPLAIILNDKAGSVSTEALLRGLSFAIASDAPSTATRTVQIQIVNTNDIPFSNAVTRNITISEVNDAPVITNTSPINLDYNTVIDKISVEDIINQDPNNNLITDPDGSTDPRGIFITYKKTIACKDKMNNDTACGTWKFSTDNGKNWNSMNQSTKSPNGLRLSADNTTLIRFELNTSVSIPSKTEFKFTFYAWDQSDGKGNNGTSDTNDSKKHGSSGPYSIDSVDVTITSP